MRDKEFPYKPWQALADFGILSLGIPEEYGGTPADIQTMTLVCETLGRHAFPLGIIYALGMITIRDIVQFGSEEIKARGAGRLCARRPAGGAGHHRAAGRLGCGRAENHRHVSTATMWSSTARRCTAPWPGMTHYIMLMTRDPQIENPYEGISMWLLPTDTPGRALQQDVAKWAGGRIPTYEVYIENARVPKTNLIGADEPGLAAADGQFRDRAPGAVRRLAGRGRRRLR